MKKKILFLLFFLLMVTGCSSSYDIEIYNNQVKEKMEFVSTSSYTWDNEVKYGFSYRELLLASYKYPYPAFSSTVVDEDDTIKLDNVEYYKNTLIDTSDKLGLMLEYNKFTLDNFNDSSIVKKCYQYFNIIEEDDNVIISTSTTNKCFDEYPLLDTITVNLKTNHKVVNSNASFSKGYHYTWNLSRENKDDAAISITIKKDEFVFNYENEFVKKVIYFIVFVGIILIVSTITYSYFKNKRINSNQI